ncbi:MFS transporter [Amnibacterium flavum]|uniref:Putative proline/betaine transporter n=1 Tax=Amnibacterium flavum TaxID=2173173 RepID=A0A2V1HVX3_9MICO|nr:MFS transporter [Amnibacterium flavum]PVZ95269.1 MFS transporter [Amnibacterium flavum]
MTDTTTAEPQVDLKEARRVSLASLVGASVEWYDFFIYGQAAALIFNKLFFPELDPVTGTLAGLATFGVGFAARPIGGIIFGHFGDRIGRKTALITTLLMMGIATVVVGFLPTYQQIGVAAPIILVALRLIQGIAVGGEWGGAVLMAVEHAPSKRRGLYGSWPQAGVPIALIAASLVLYLLSVTLTDEQFEAWGWRIPFLASIVLIAIGLIIRLKISESPLFRKLQQEGRQLKVPILDVLRNAFGRVVLVIFVQAALNVGFYIISTYALTYATQNAGFSRADTLVALTIGAILDFLAIPLWAALSDRIGRRPVIVIGALVLGVFMWPFFLLVDTGNPVLLVLAVSIGLVFGHAPFHSVLSTFLPETFDVQSRYTGVSLGYQFSGAIISGPTPLVAAALVTAAGSYYPVIVMMGVATVVTLVCLALLKETQGRDMSQQLKDSAAPSTVSPAER